MKNGDVIDINSNLYSQLKNLYRIAYSVCYNRVRARNKNSGAVHDAKFYKGIEDYIEEKAGVSMEWEYAGKEQWRINAPHKKFTITDIDTLLMWKMKQ